MSFQSLYQLDTYIFNCINHLPHPQFLNMLASVLHLGTRGLIIYIPFIAVLLIYRQYKQTLFVVATMISTLGVVDLIFKHFFARPRPFQVLTNVITLLPLPTSWSFPSSETAVAFAVTMMCVLIFKSPRRHWAWTWALIVGFDRIYMGHHYPSDVLAGAFVGVVVSYTVFELLRRTKILQITTQDKSDLA